jgi:agmatinase
MDAKDFNPNNIGLNNGHFIGLPFTEEEAKIVAISVPWDVTVSSGEGTAAGPDNILQASLQLDLFQAEIPNAWKLGIYVRPVEKKWRQKNAELRSKARDYISFLEEGGDIAQSVEMQDILDEINLSCEQLYDYVYHESKKIIEKGKIPAVLGGEHSSPLGLLKAMRENHGAFGVLHIDAHMDLRNAYEGFTYSHASIFNNAVNQGFLESLTQVGIRDYCDEEEQFAKEYQVNVFYDDKLKSASFEGISWRKQCDQIIKTLPEKVYISFDIDGLNPHLCPNTGTPVPGGLEFAEAIYLVKELVKSGRKIIGFDLCEVGGENDWDGNVGARVLYNLCNWAGRSQGWI